MDDQLKELLSYTKWHIGLYAGLLTTLIAALTAPILAGSRHRKFLLVTLVAFGVAGMAGGIVGSSIPDYTYYRQFMSDELGPWGWEMFPAVVWIRLEHTSFWIGSLVAVVGVFFQPSSETKKSVAFE